MRPWRREVRWALGKLRRPPPCEPRCFPDDGDNEKLYGKKVSGEQIFSGTVPAPSSAKDLIAELEKASPTKIVAENK
jgi:hypothetical protein